MFSPQESRVPKSGFFSEILTIVPDFLKKWPILVLYSLMSGKPALIRMSQILEPKFILRLVERNSLNSMKLRDDLATRGILNPILLRPADRLRKRRKPFEIVDGFHRFTFWGQLGHRTIPAYIRYDLRTDEDVLTAQIAANVHRKDTDPIEYARHIQRLQTMRPELRMSDIASMLNQDTQWIYHQLGLLNLIPDAQRMVNEGVIPLTTAYKLSKMPEVLQVQALPKAVDLSTQDFKEYADKAVRLWHGSHPKGAILGPRMRSIQAIDRELKTHKAMVALCSRVRPKTTAEIWDLCLLWQKQQDIISLEERTARLPDVDLMALYKEERQTPQS